MLTLREVQLPSQPLERFTPLLGQAAVDEALAAADRLRRAAAGHRVWSINSTAIGGGVAEMLRSLLTYARGAPIDVRWLVIDGDREFFRITKRIHNALHGERGDGSPLDGAERAHYERISQLNAEAFFAMVGPARGDVALLHDPQTAGLAPAFVRAGLTVVWRCHIGAEFSNEQTNLGWSFLAPSLDVVHGRVFSRKEYVPAMLSARPTAIIQPSIDPFSAKNQEMPQQQIHDVLATTGLVGHTSQTAVPFQRPDGSRGEVAHAADIMRLGSPPAPTVPLVVQVSRWDTLKDPIGVLQGFAALAKSGGAANADLMLCGPNVVAVADDPDGARVFEQVVMAWRALPHELRRRVTLASLPVHDVDENAIIVNAIQRHAAVVIQKSLREGFGLTVTEAMWKARPVVASRVGGIADQIVDGDSGLLLDDPSDLAAFGRLISRALTQRELAQKLGARAYERARDEFLCLRHLRQFADLFVSLLH